MPKIILLIVAAVLLLGRPISAYACACCAEQWDHALRKEQLAPFIHEGLSQLHLMGNTTIEADSAITFGPYETTAQFKQGALLIALSNAQGSVGTIRFQLPKDYENFQAHLQWVLPEDLYKTYLLSHKQDDKEPALLYKEMRLSGTVALESPMLLKQGIALPKQATLTLSGHGSRCFAANDYHHWLLQFEVQKGKFSEVAVGRGKVVAK